jgi:hypothetical protein
LALKSKTHSTLIRRAKSWRVDGQAGFFLAVQRWLNDVEQIQKNDDRDRNPYEPQQNSTHGSLLVLIAFVEPPAAGHGSPRLAIYFCHIGTHFRLIRWRGVDGFWSLLKAPDPQLNLETNYELNYLSGWTGGRCPLCAFPPGPALGLSTSENHRTLIDYWSKIMANVFSDAASDISVEIGNPTNYVDWGAIAAGVFVSLAVTSVFLAFGSAIGLSMTSFQPSASAPVIGVVIAAALWFLWVQVSSFMGGGYVAGRMRRRIGDAKAHEVEMRDGAHGLIVWAVNIVIGAALAGFLTLAGIGGAIGVAATSDSGAMDYYADRLMRGDAAAGTTAAPADTQSNAQISRILTRNVAARTFDETDRAYVVREISTRTGLAEADAQKRLDDAVATLRAQAETARRYAVLFAFLTAASFLVSGVAAWWAATAGGKHRDEGIDHSHLSRWR